MKIKLILVLTGVLLTAVLAIGTINRVKAFYCPGVCFPCSSNPDACCRTAPFGGFGEVPCGSTSPSVSPSHTPTPTPTSTPSSQIIFHGELTLPASNEAKFKKMLQGATVLVKKHDGTAASGIVTYSTTTNQATYSITTAKNKDGSNNYTLTAKRSRFFDEEKELTTTSSDNTVNFVMEPSIIVIKGTIIESETRKGVEGAMVIGLMHDDAGEILAISDHKVDTDQAGKFAFFMTVKKADQGFPRGLSLSVIIPSFENFGGTSDYTINILDDPETNLGDILVADVKECETIQTTEFCWIGKEAVDWHHDSSKGSIWLGVADLLNQLKVKTKVTIKYHVEIKSLLSNAFADPENLTYIGVGTQIIGDRCKFVQGCLSDIVTHEFGHTFELHSSLINPSDWTALYNEQVASGGSAWSYVTDSSYNVMKYGGHPQGSDLELFASSFMIMDRYRPVFTSKIFRQSGSTKDWLKRVYNKHASSWLGIPTFTWLRSLAISFDGPS